MVATKVGIVYSIALRKRRWMVVPDSDTELPLPVKQGEAYIEQLFTDYQQRGPDAAVQDASGGVSLSDRCAVIDNTNTVTSHVNADPAIDNIAGMTLVQSDVSIAGDTFSQGTFNRTWAQVNSSNTVTGFTTAAIGTTPVAANVGGRVVFGHGLTQGAVLALAPTHSTSAV